MPGKRHKRLLLYSRLFIMAITLLCCVSFAYAADIPWSGSDEAGNAWDLQDYAAQWQDIYSMVAAISIPMGAVSFAFGAYKVMLGNEKLKEIDIGKKQMQITVIAVAAIQVLPAVITFAYGLVSGYQWDPYHP